MMIMKMRWLGNAGFSFRFNDLCFLVDPFLTRPHWTQVYFGRCQPDKAAIAAHAGACGLVLVTHSHFDHFMDVPVIAKQNGAVVCGSHNTCGLACQLGVPREHVKQIGAGEEFEWRGVRVKAIKASHPFIPGYGKVRLSKKLSEPLHLRDYRMDNCLSFLIQAGGTRVLIWSSTGTAGAEGADVLICRTVAKESWYKQLLEQVHPRLVIPSH